GVMKFYLLLMEEKLVSVCASREMLSILKNQRLKGKMPFFLSPMGIKTAHKTGEDDGITHDTGVIFTNPACVAVFLSNNVSVPDFERFIQDASLALVK
ncbi:MAG: serine hydrolase, partial [Clostridia bacterium]|nr:serine hydrolase [Clostridia bacterium]